MGSATEVKEADAEGEFVRERVGAALGASVGDVGRDAATEAGAVGSPRERSAELAARSARLVRPLPEWGAPPRMANALFRTELREAPRLRVLLAALSGPRTTSDGQVG